jgi:hypothetical protein
LRSESARNSSADQAAKRIKVTIKKPIKPTNGILIPPDRADEEVDEPTLSVILQHDAPPEPKPKGRPAKKTKG